MTELLEAFGVDWRLLIIQALNFGLLLLVLWHFLYKPVLRILEDRRQKIAEGVTNAETAERNLAVSETKGREIVSKATREAEGIVVAAKERAGERGSEIIREAEARAVAVLREAEAKSAEAKRQALLSSEKEIARAAVLAAEKILRGASH